MVRLLKQDEQVILKKIVGRGDLIDGRHRRGHIDNKYNFNSNDDGEHRDPPPIHNDLISGVQRDEFGGNENLNLIELNGIDDLGQKRAMAIRNKMIEMEPAIKNQIKIEAQNEKKYMSSEMDYYHILFIRIDARCLQESNKCPYNIEMEQSKKIEAHLADKSMDDGCNKVGHTTVLKYALPTKEACEVFEGCKYYDSQTMTEAMQKSYLHHDNKLLGKYNDEDADTSSNSTQRSQIGDQSIFSQHLKVLPSCIHVQSRKAACPITVLCKDECDCLQCKNQTKPNAMLKPSDWLQCHQTRWMA